MSEKNWLDLLRASVSETGSIAAAARFIGVSSAAVSTALAGKYPASTRKLEVKVLEKLLNAVDCPHLAARIAHDECASMRTRRSPGTREKLDHWLACQDCPVGDAKGLPRSRFAPPSEIKGPVT
ncbi:MAG TPA: LysR family transcriptional regulator [Stellaceae bacterium]|jgi:hypothetical protein